jgi:hypothetical protein
MVSLIANFEKRVFISDDAEFEDLISLLRSAMRADSNLDSLAMGEVPTGVVARATRIAAACGALMAKPRIKLRDREFLSLLTLSHTLQNLLASSGYGGSDHLLLQLSAATPEELKVLARTDRQRFLKAILLFSIDSRQEIDFEWLLNEEPKLGSLVYLGLLAAKPITSIHGHARRERLLAVADQLVPFLPQSTDLLVLLSNAWMQCSYADLVGKHRIKAVLNRYLRSWLSALGCSDVEIGRDRHPVGRPRILVAAEVMRSDHVQYRYFGQYLRQLRKRFHLILLTEEGQADDHVRNLYDEVITFPRTADPKYLCGVRDLIVDSSPDLIFWLSVGMRHWGTALSNLRLARIQFTALGHSASTFSDQIDYYLTEEGYVGDPSLFSEKLLLLPDKSLRFEKPPNFNLPLPPQPLKLQERVLRVALPSNLLKLNPVYISTLQEIVQKVDRAIEFYVFPNVSGPELITTRRVLAEALPRPTVFPILKHGAYAERLASCHLNLSPFPFGGLHSVIDSIRAGIPVIALEGAEPHARTDAMLIRRLGMPDWTIAQSVKSYVEKACAVLSDDKLRLSLSQHARSIRVDEVMFGDATTPLDSNVVDCIEWVYRHHERLMHCDQKVFRHPEWST